MLHAVSEERQSEEDIRHAISHVTLKRLRGPRTEDAHAPVAHEEPLEVQLGATSLAVLMRTPGHDEELVKGFLVTERVVERLDRIASVHHCSTAPEDTGENVVRVTLAPGTEIDLESLRRNLFASSSCGVCGKATIENAMATAPPLDDDVRISRAVLASLPGRLRPLQHAFAATGGSHAAALATPSGDLLVVREDVGRHNAVDKVVGWALENGRLPLTEIVLLVSGRISFEIVQKALAARIPVVAAVSAPTSLAVELAEQAHMTLVAFLREDTMSVYTHPERVA